VTGPRRGCTHDIDTSITVTTSVRSNSFSNLSPVNEAGAFYLSRGDLRYAARRITRPRNMETKVGCLLQCPLKRQTPTGRILRNGVTGGQS